MAFIKFVVIQVRGVFDGGVNLIEVSGDRKLENGPLFPRMFKAITRPLLLHTKFHKRVINVKRLCTHHDFSLG